MKVALIGNQNSGKTTLFNLLTGSNQKVGNWPGVTIERKVGKIKSTDIEIVDLPGIYSLSPYTAEEEISRNFIINENVDLIINIVDATSLERSLYLTTQLLELDCDVVVALNMSDLLAKKGIKLDVDALANELGVKVVLISALKSSGIDELISIVRDWQYIQKEKLHIYPKQVEAEISKVEDKITFNHPRFAAVKLIENDNLYKNQNIIQAEISRKTIESYYNTDAEEIIASLRYDYIVSIRDKVIDSSAKKQTITDKLDKVFLNRFAAIPIFAIIMIAIYVLSVGVIGSFTVDLVDGLVGRFSDLVASFLENINGSPWLVSLVCDGIIAGVGAMLNFVPQLTIMFICIALLEVTGYMNRISFFLDKVFKKFGLSGKSLIPFIVGSGCSVPGIMTTRTIDSEDEKKMTILLTPFIPCSAKLPIIALFASALFPGSGIVSGLISASVYFIAIAVILVAAIILKKFLYKGDSSAFISELPEYKLPSFKYVARDVLEKIWSFIKRAGTVILLCSVVIWLLLSFTWTFKYTDAESTTLDNFNIEDYYDDFGIEELGQDNIVIVKVIDQEIKIMITQDGKDLKDEYVSVVKIEDLLKDIEKDKNKSVFAQFNAEENTIEWKYAYGIEKSILASIGKAFSWLLYPMIGEANWGAAVSAVQGLVAKEQVVASMSVIGGFGEALSDADGAILVKSDAFSVFNPNVNPYAASASFAFMLFNLFSAPCFGAIGAMHKEYGNIKRTAIAVGFQTGLAYVLACCTFGIGSLITLLIGLI